MNDHLKEQLVLQFRHYLDTADVNLLNTTEHIHASTDAFSLLAELTALKSEVKHESRHVKDALQEFKNVFATLQRDNDALAQELAWRKTRESEQQQAALKPLLIQLLEIHDRLEAALAITAPPTRSLTSWFSRAERQWIEATRAGQQITLQRLNGILDEHQVKVMETPGLPLDPHTMRAMETTHRPDLADGVVVSELRKGFLWQGALLRAAEVQVNKLTESPN